jgi:hypothetical protein
MEYFLSITIVILVFHAKKNLSLSLSLVILHLHTHNIQNLYSSSDANSDFGSLRISNLVTRAIFPDFIPSSLGSCSAINLLPTPQLPMQVKPLYITSNSPLFHMVTFFQLSTSLILSLARRTLSSNSVLCTRKANFIVCEYFVLLV